MPYDFQFGNGMRGGGFGSYGQDGVTANALNAAGCGRKGDMSFGAKGYPKGGKDVFGGKPDSGGKSSSFGRGMDSRQFANLNGPSAQPWSEPWKGGFQQMPSGQMATFDQQPPKGGKGKQNAGGNAHGNQIGVSHSNLFVSNLPGDVTEQNLRNAFTVQGRVVSCRIFTRNDRTCALVKMSTPQEAELACREWGQQKGVGNQQTRWMVKMAHADAGYSEGKGKDMLAQFGGSKGGAFGKGGDGFTAKGGKAGFGANPAAGLAPGFGKGNGKSRKEREPVQTAPSDNLYVKGIPPQTTEAQLKTTFAKVGRVVELKLLHYGDSLECAALVRMDSVESAQAAIDKLNGTTPEGSVPPISVVYKGKDPQVSSDNLFVKGLPANFSAEHIQLLFGQHGTVRRCRILDVPTPNFTALGTAALVQMSSVEEADRAMKALNGTTPSGFSPQMLIRFAEPKPRTANELKPNANLFVKGLPLATPDFLLRAVFAQYGNVVRLKVLEPQNNEVTDSAALVQMASIEEAKAAIEGLHGRMLATSLPAMRIRYAGKEQQPGPNLYVAGLPFAIQEQQLRATFSRCGAVVRLRLLQQSGKPETHALVLMGSTEEAESAIKQLNGQPPDNLGPMLIVRYAQQRQKEKTDDSGESPGDKPEEDDDDDAPKDPTFDDEDPTFDADEEKD
jgi:RNA recognition motif-containing protein